MDEGCAANNTLDDEFFSWNTDDDLSDEEDVCVATNDDGTVACTISFESYAESSDSSEEEHNDGNDDRASPQPQTTSLLPNQISGKNGAVWEHFSSRVPGRTRAHNIFTANSGVPRAIARSIVTPYDAWKHFIHQSILRIIVKYTNEEAQRRGNTSFSLDLQKLEAFIGLQYARGIYGKDHPVAFSWSEKYDIPIFYETMGRNSSLEILKLIRFDDKPNRIRRRPNVDKFAPIKEVFEKFSSLCQSKYVCDFFLLLMSN